MKEHSNNVAPDLILLFTDQYHAQPLSEKLPSVAEGNKYSDPQPDNTQRMRDLGKISPKRGVSIKPLLNNCVILLLSFK